MNNREGLIKLSEDYLDLKRSFSFDEIEDMFLEFSNSNPITNELESFFFRNIR